MKFKHSVTPEFRHRKSWILNPKTPSLQIWEQNPRTPRQQNNIPQVLELFRDQKSGTRIPELETETLKLLVLIWSRIPEYWEQNSKNWRTTKTESRIPEQTFKNTIPRPELYQFWDQDSRNSSCLIEFQSWNSALGILEVYCSLEFQDKKRRATKQEQGTPGPQELRDGKKEKTETRIPRPDFGNRLQASSIHNVLMQIIKKHLQTTAFRFPGSVSSPRLTFYCIRSTSVHLT